MGFLNAVHTSVESPLEKPFEGTISLPPGPLATRPTERGCGSDTGGPSGVGTS